MIYKRYIKILHEKNSDVDATIEQLLGCAENSLAGTNEISLPEINLRLDADEFVDFLGELYQTFLSADIAVGVRKKRDLGIYFTNRQLCDRLTQDAIHNLTIDRTPRFLEPAAGMGAFVFAYLRAVLDDSSIARTINLTNRQDILDSIFLVEKDRNSAQLLLRVINSYLQTKYSNSLHFPEKNMYIGDAILDSELASRENLLSRFEAPGGFDLILTNPPYRLLKATHRDSPALKAEITALSNLSSKSEIFKSLSGVNNLYKFFICNIMEDWLSKDGVAGVVVPRSLLTDYQSFKLRMQLLTTCQLGNIYDVPEGSNYFKGIGQAFSLFTFQKKLNTEFVKIFSLDVSEDLSDSTSASIKPISFYQKITPEVSILPLRSNEIEFLESLMHLPRVKDCPQVVNLRGELDLSLDKHFITNEIQDFKLVQGVDLQLYKLRNLNKFVSPDFSPSVKSKWSRVERIACQQISNARQERRLKWALIPEMHVLGNSCNFIAVEADSIFQEESPVLTTYLLAVFNSFFMNKRFKLLSRNNHIANNEISNMPLIIPEIETQNEIDKLVKSLLTEYDLHLHLKIEEILSATFQIPLIEEIENPLGVN